MKQSLTKKSALARRQAREQLREAYRRSIPVKSPAEESRR
jgi:hypothetical protein